MQTPYDAANFWQAIDTTAPEAPVNLQATANRTNGITLEWDLLPDMESSTKAYRIYRNNSLAYDWTQDNGGAELQPIGGGDEVADGSLPEMRYVDKDIIWGSTYTYEVSSVNKANIESPRSASLAVKTGAANVVTPQSIRMRPAGTHPLFIDGRNGGALAGKAVYRLNGSALHGVTGMPWGVYLIIK
jgi:hypothetical protein